MKGSDGMTTLKLELQSKDVSQLEQELVTATTIPGLQKLGLPQQIQKSSNLLKCPKVMVLLTFWKALGEVKELIYKS